MSSIDNLLQRIRNADFLDDFERRLESKYEREAQDLGINIPKTADELITEANTRYVAVRDGLYQKDMPKLLDLLSTDLDYMEAIEEYLKANDRGSASKVEAAFMKRRGFHDAFIKKLLEYDSHLRDKYSDSDIGKKGIYTFDRSHLTSNQVYRGMIAVWGTALLIGIRNDLLKDERPEQGYVRPE